MKLFRFGKLHHEKPGVVYNGTAYDCSDYFADWNKSFFDANGLNELVRTLEDNANRLNQISEHQRFGSCVARPGKTICIGLNYSDHANEVKMEIPKEPTIFMKATSSISGPYDDIILPPNSQKTDWEIELGIVIGKTIRYLTTHENADQYIAGYTISHDVSERAYQLERGGQWSKGKSCDSFNPIGPYLVTKDEIVNVSNLSLKLMVNGEIRQHSNTKHMIFNPQFIVYYLSQFMTLEAGDIISTGTPAGVGMSMSPPQFLAEGDVVELEIESLGTQKQKCRRYVAI